MLSVTSILSGTAFEDVDGNGQRDPGESVLESVTVYLDQNDNGVLDRLGLEPDQFEAGQTIGDRLPDATVWTTFRGDLAALAESADTSITSTGSRAFANQFGDVAFSDAAYRLEIDISNTVNALSIDFTAIDANAVGRLEVRDSNFNVLGTFTTSPLTTGRSEAMVISVPGIAYAIASSTDALTGTLDNLTLGDGNEPAAITDSSGQYAFMDLAEGDFVIREVAPLGYEQSYPQASVSRLFAIDPNVTHSARIVEIDPYDGTTIRAFNTPGNVTSSTAGLAFDGSTLFFVDSTDDTLYELDPNTGAVLDSMSLDPTPRWDGVAVLDGLVYVNDPTANILLMIDPSTNSVVNTVNIPASNFEPFGGLGELPDASGGKLIGPVGNSNVVALLDPMTGAMTSSFAHAFVSDGDNFGATSIDGLIYLGFNDAAGTVQVYQPDGTLVRSFQTGFDMSGLGAANSLDGSHRVSVSVGETRSGLDFGNVRQTGSISGTKFEDIDGNGQRGAGEGPLAGVTIYLDANNNSVLDAGEQSTQTAADGTYQFTSLPFDDYIVREVVSSDFIQTTPATRDAFFYAVAGAANELITIDAATGEVEHIGLFGTDMNGLVHTRSGELFGLQGTGTDSFYSIDTTTGAATLIGPTGDVVFGLAYDEPTDTIYTIRNMGATRHLAAIDRATGTTTVIGPGSGNVVNVSGIAFDAASNQVIAFDNLDDEFWGFDVETGVVTLLSDTSNFAAYGFTPVGNDFVMSTTQGNLVQIDPFTATVTPYLTMSEILGIDALDYVPASDGAHHVTVQAGAVQDQVDFGNQRRGLKLSIDDSTINENGGTTTATVTRNTDTAEDLLVYLSSGDLSEVSVPPTVTIPAGQTSATFVVSGMDDAIRDGTQTVSISASMSATNSTNYTDSFSGSELSSFWEAFTDIPDSSVTQNDGVLRVESPTAPSNFSDTGVRSQITAGDSDFTAEVDFRIPMGRAMSWLSGSAGSDQTYGVYLYPPQNSYRIWIDNPGFTGSVFGASAFGDESTNWHQLSLRYDAATQTVQSFVDGSQVNSAIVDLSGGHISLTIKDRSSLGSGPTVVEFDNFSLTYASTVGVVTASVTVLDDEGPSDFGDAPDSYRTLLASNGPRHLLTPLSDPLRLGSSINPEIDGQPSAGSDADISDDGLGMFEAPAGNTGQLQVYVSGNNGSGGKLDAWLDFNQDGDFDDAGEQIFASIHVDAGMSTRSFGVPADALAGETVLRLRLSSAGGLLHEGAADDGEVEDHRVFVNRFEDFGDAPDSYRTLLASNGPRHLLVPLNDPLRLGSSINPEIDGQPSAGSDADISDDGLGMFEAPAGNTGQLQVYVSGNNGSGGKLDAWLDFNQDGDFDDAGEQIFASVHVDAGLSTRSFGVPADALAGETVLRLRLSSAGGLLHEGAADDGEVEDHRVFVNRFEDFGDAPDSYRTLLASNGPRHLLVPLNDPLRLGSSINPEIDGQPSAGSDADISDDGLGMFEAPAGNTGQLQVYVSGNNGSGGKLDAWLDFNQDGDFDDAGEQIFASVHVDAGLSTRSFGVPLGAVAGETVLRLRLSSTGGLSHEGAAGDGEVQDHRVYVAPAVLLLSVDRSAINENGGVANATLTRDTDTSDSLTVAIVSSKPDEATVPATVTIPAGQQSVSFSIEAMNDAVVDGTQSVSVTATATGFIGDSVLLDVIDDEMAGVQVRSTGPMVVDESGSTATFNVDLAAAPLTPVVVTITSADTSEVTVSPMTLTFTSADWNISQTVTITGIDDLIVDGNQLTDITVAVDPAVSDDAFDSVPDQSVSMQTNDNDVAQVLVSPTNLITQENGAPQTFQVGINAVPTSDVLITIHSTNTLEGTIDVSEIVFTPDNFTPVTVTVTPVDDLLAGSLDGDMVYSIITSPVVSVDPRFSGLDPADVTVTNEDNDTPVNQSVSATAGSLITGTESGSFADTAADDSSYQVLTESAVGVTGGKKPQQGSVLEYHWTFTGLENANEFYVDAYRAPNSDGDDFSFEYSVDGGASWNSLVTISSASPGNTVSVTGLSVSGDVLVRVVDTDRSPAKGRDTPSLQSIYVDQLYFRMSQEDLRPAVIVSAIASAADENPSTPGVVRIERAEATTEPLVVQYLVSGNATSGEDYAALTGTASIAANQTYVDVVITPLDDVVEEGAESVTLTLVDAVHYRVLGNDSASVTIADDDLQAFTATGESGSGGTVNGDFTRTHDDDNVAQTITERESGGKKSDRHTFLEHTWQFNVSGANSLYIDAATEAIIDDFVFAWSIDGVNFTELATIGTGSNAIGPTISQMFAVPDLSGTVYVRVTDTNRTAGERVEESLAVDQLFFSTLPVLDHSSQSDPTYDLSFSATSVTDEDETLLNLDRVFEELARSSKRH